MLYGFTWFAVVSLLALWSLAAWAFHAIAAWAVAPAAVLADGAGAIEALRLPDWLASWMSPELAATFTLLSSAFLPAIEAVLGWAPALAGGLSVAVWVVWAIGSVLFIGLGFVVTGFVAAKRRRAFVLAAPARGPAALGWPGDR